MDKKDQNEKAVFPEAGGRYGKEEEGAERAGAAPKINFIFIQFYPGPVLQESLFIFSTNI